MKTVIIGGGAAGASCAARLRRLDESAEIIILEKTNEISIANCGLPYYVSDVISEREKMLVSNPEKFKGWFNIDVRLNCEVVKINREEKSVSLKNGDVIYYDKLVLAQGAAPVVPGFEGMDKTKVFTLRTLADADRIKDFIKKNNVKKAVVSGGGFIGIEMAENLAHTGIKTTLVELANQILAPVDAETARFAQNALEERGVEVVLSDGISRFSGNKVILNSNRELEFDIVIMAIGVRPEINLAKEAGLETNRGIVTDEFMRTSDKDIFAGGDSVEVLDFVSADSTLIPLAGPANRQGRIIADNICSVKSSYKKTQGTSVIKVFDLTIASVGNSEKQLKSKNIPYWKTYIYGRSHAGYYPDSCLIFFKLLFDGSGKILGAQAAGEEGVEKRIDVISSIMRLGGSVYDMASAELSYAPPYSSAKDPVNILGMNAENILRGLVKPAYLEDLEDAYLIDVRPAVSYQTNTIPNAFNIPVDQIRKRTDEIPKDKKVVLFCNTGHTSYIASRILAQKGFNNVYSLAGGIELYKELRKNAVAQTKQKVYAVKSNDTKALAALRIDASGMQCPGPIMKVSDVMKELSDGDIAEVISTDKGFKSDIDAWCKNTSNRLVSLVEENKKIIATIQKGNSVPHKNTGAFNGQTIVVFSNDLDKALASFIIANGAKASGKDVTMFFTFWGLNILRKPDVSVKKGIIDKIFALLMPKGAEKLVLSKMNMGGAGTAVMKYVMKKKNISTLNELIQQAKDSGVKFIACNMSMDVMGIKKEELIDGVEIAGVAKYISECSTSNSNLFI